MRTVGSQNKHSNEEKKKEKPLFCAKKEKCSKRKEGKRKTKRRDEAERKSERLEMLIIMERKKTKEDWKEAVKQKREAFAVNQERKRGRKKRKAEEEDEKEAERKRDLGEVGGRGGEERDEGNKKQLGKKQEGEEDEKQAKGLQNCLWGER